MVPPRILRLVSRRRDFTPARRQASTRRRATPPRRHQNTPTTHHILFTCIKLALHTKTTPTRRLDAVFQYQPQNQYPTRCAQNSMNATIWLLKTTSSTLPHPYILPESCSRTLTHCRSALTAAAKHPTMAPLLPTPLARHKGLASQCNAVSPLVFM